MTSFVELLKVTVRLHLRNRMALIYSYIFPAIFLVAFFVIYRYERVPLIRHMGELLTVTVLGSACFGLPTSLVSERERGVWRRYRLAPIATSSLIATTVIGRYLLLIVAGLFQLALAMAIGMPMPRHPLDLFVAFTLVSFAFLGLGLVIAMLADNVPAVQALGQCIFLPMLIIGGVAVPLASLPDWAQHLSAFFPGRYAVEAIQATVNGAGLAAVPFSALALTMIGLAGCVAGAKLFRWDAQQRFATQPGKAWLAVALSAWAAVGLAAESRGRIAPRIPADADSRTAPAAVATATQPPGATETTPTAAGAPSERSAPTDLARVDVRAVTTGGAAANAAPRGAAGDSAVRPTPSAAAPGAGGTPTTAPTGTPASPAPPPAPAAVNAPPSAAPATIGPPDWRQVTIKHIEEELIFTRLPPDSGVVTPIATADDDLPDTDAAGQIELIRERLATWGPGKVADPVQRVRNFLYVAAVPDLFQLSIERYIPAVVFERIQADVPKEQLIQVLFWIAVHQFEGDDRAVDDLRVLGLGNGPSDMEEARNRAAIYAVKLLGRVLGKIVDK